MASRAHARVLAKSQVQIRKSGAGLIRIIPDPTAANAVTAKMAAMAGAEEHAEHDAIVMSEDELIELREIFKTVRDTPARARNRA